MITFVYAQDKKGAIGYRNKLPWHLPNDLQFFKKITMGHTLLMGRKTFESMGKRLLPGRKTVVLTEQLDYGTEIEGLTVIHTVAEALTLAEQQELMVIGGSGVFTALLPYADKIIRTFIDAEFTADTHMPPINEAEWQLEATEQGTTDERNQYPHHFEWWTKNKGVD